MRLSKTKTLLLGIGNPIMGDDGVGIHVVRILKQQLGTRDELEFKELSVGGLKLVEAILGHENVIIIDSYASTTLEQGRIREFAPDQFKETLNITSPHDTNFATALELYKNLQPERIPKKITIFTIDINPTLTFSEKMSSPIQKAASKLADVIMHTIEHPREQDQSTGR